MLILFTSKVQHVSQLLLIKKKIKKKTICSLKPQRNTCTPGLPILPDLPGEPGGPCEGKKTSE